MEPPSAPILEGVHAEDVRQFWDRANVIAWPMNKKMDQ